ncbi:Leucine-rich repeat (LRR) family protein [Rhynchospora pubera]|uniref:Leucine-rich repeat (LRR) family protein n=1 Tax=Rhynchospora pubera TaxID=906938 RepID=A0AAV8EBX8_9POAL|nr:Leucine-rich repeat (LRR) family protein [Rhynchospora pubera]
MTMSTSFLIAILILSVSTVQGADYNFPPAPSPGSTVQGGHYNDFPPGPSPSAQPNPKDFQNMKQFLAYLVIQRFKRTITYDPLNITGTWVGTRICDNDDLNTYRGFFCDTPPNTTDLTVASIDFNGFHLGAPTLDGFINGFPDLALFHANSNNFGGTVPNLLGLQYLYELDFSNNKLSGLFPTNVVPLSGLAFLDLRFNFFQGHVPPPIFLIGYEALFLNNNFFNSSIPANLGSSPVEYLTFANNRFTGPIPVSICNTSSTVLEVLFLNNQLSGCLPYEIGYLRDITVFDAGLNKLTGHIPLSFGCLSNVQELNLAQNYLYGEVPEVVCQLARTGNLVNLSLSDNFFTALGVNCWDLIHNNVLDVRWNCIPGLPHQRPFEECAWFLSLPKLCPLVPYMPCEANPGRQNTTCYNDWASHFDHNPPMPPLPPHASFNQLRKGKAN